MTVSAERTSAGAALSRRTLVVGAGLAATAAVAGVLTPRRYEAGVTQVRLEGLVPDVVGPWRMRSAGVFILPEAVAAASAYDQVFTRRFAAPTGPDIMLLIAHGAAQSGLMRIHRPEVCYSSEGFRIEGLHDVDLAIASPRVIPAQIFTGVRDDRVERVLYWTRIASFFPRDLTAQRLIMLKLGLAGMIPEGVLVRISAQAAGEATPALEAFAKDLVRRSTPQAQALLLGADSSQTPKPSGP